MQYEDSTFWTGDLLIRSWFFGFWSKCHCELHRSELFVRKNKKTSDILKRLVITPETKVNLVECDGNPSILIDVGEKNQINLRGDEDTVIQAMIAIKSATFRNSNLNMDNFKINAVIGRGFYGKVMLVTKLDTSDVLALKTIHKMTLARSNKMQIAINERAVLQQLKHPFIVDFKFAFQTSTKFYIGLEYVPGGDLRHLLKIKKTLPLHDVKIYVAEMALALDYMHSLGILYRDLKPENVLIGIDGHVKITDFGLSKNLHNERTKTFCGTYEYLAAEMISGNAYSFQIDWWALGIITYELLFGKTPFADENKGKLCARILTADPVYPNYADPVTIDFINKLLTKDPMKRANFSSLKTHSFFDELNMDDVFNKTIFPYYIPDIIDVLQPDQFAEEYTREDRVDSLATPPIGTNCNVKGFSFASDCEPEIDFAEVHSLQN